MKIRPSGHRQEAQQALAAGNLSAALRHAVAWAAAEPRNAAAWCTCGQAHLGLGNVGDAEPALERALRLAPGEPGASLSLAIVHHRLGKSGVAIDRCRALAAGGGARAVDASLALAEMLDRAGRHAELTDLCASRPWGEDPRGAIFSLRVLGRSDPRAAANELVKVARGAAPAHARRIAGFDAVRLLDACGEYRQAFGLAAEVHAATGAPFDTGGLVAHVAAQRALLDRGRRWFEPRAPEAPHTALIAALPRSGTTLLEQMLDCHPAISGIGEFEGMLALGQRLVGAGAWPGQLGLFAEGAECARTYLDGARARCRAGAVWSLDKSLVTWQWLPAVAAVLPGSVVFALARDPRDMAISLLLSNFNPVAFGWAASLADIRRVIEAERSILPRALEVLGMRHEALVYEDLVADPAAAIARCLACMGLPAHEACLAPQANTRTVLTLSHAQVRKPINTSSIGRWKNYEFAFDASWGVLAGANAAVDIRR